MGYINVSTTAFYVTHDLQGRKSWQEYPVEILKGISVSGSNNSSYQKVFGRFGSVPSNTQNQNLVQKLICQKRK